MILMMVGWLLTLLYLWCEGRENRKEREQGLSVDGCRVVACGDLGGFVGASKGKKRGKMKRRVGLVLD